MRLYGLICLFIWRCNGLLLCFYFWVVSFLYCVFNTDVFYMFLFCFYVFKNFVFVLKLVVLFVAVAF